MKGLGLTPLFGDRRGFMPPQLKTKHIAIQTTMFQPIVFVTLVVRTAYCDSQARLWACGRGDVSTPSFESHRRAWIQTILGPEHKNVSTSGESN